MLRLLHPCTAGFFLSSSFEKHSHNLHPIIRKTASLINTYSTQNVVITSMKKCSHHLGSPSFSECNAQRRVTRKSWLESASGTELGTDAEIDQYSKVGLQRDFMPKHVAILLDGNRRWFKSHGKPVDYMPFFAAKMLLVDLCLKWGVPTATSSVYGIKTFGRGKEANDFVFRQFEEWLNMNVEVFMRKGVRVCIIGERQLVHESLQYTLKKVEEATRDNTKLELILGVCYEGRNDIMQATKSICKKVKAGEIEPEAVDEAMIERHLSTNTARNPNPDLLIRTGGYLLLSNFMMWELADSELYFTDVYPPEFSEAEFIQALCSYQKTERAFDK